MSRLFALLLVALLAVSSASAQTASEDVASTTSLAAVASGQSIGIGEPLTLSLGLPNPDAYSDVRVALPKEQEGLATIERTYREGGDWKAVLRLIKPGQVSIGPLKLTALRPGDSVLRFETAPVTIDVVEPNVGEAEPADYLPPREAPINWLRIALIVGAALLVVIAGLVIAWRLLRRMKREAAMPAPEPQLSPLEEAFAALHAVENLDAFRAHGTDGHYEALSTILRRYLGRQYGFQALEMTEDEIADHIRSAFMGHPAAPSLLAMLDHASLGKFARWQATETVARQDVQSLSNFLHTEERRQVATEPAGREVA